MNFIRSIGIEVTYASVNQRTFLPGLLIHNGIITVDRDQLQYPGDILHEAGHLAVVPEAERSEMTDGMIEQREHRAAEEMMAIAWSFAACVHLGIHPYFVFHDGGYQNGGKNIADNFLQERYFGVPALQWVGMTYDPNHKGNENKPTYPNMIRWLRP